MAIVDVVISTVLYFGGKYAGAHVDDIKFLVAAFQPVVIMVIAGITVEDTAKQQANAKMQVAHTQAQSAMTVAAVTGPAPAADSRPTGQGTPWLGADHEPYNRTNEPAG